MGEVVVEVLLENAFDRHLVRTGVLRPEGVRQLLVEALVDTGATALILPEAVVQTLGLDLTGSTEVEFADGRVTERPIAESVYLSLEGRARGHYCFVGARGARPLLGQIVLESLDLLVDCKNQRLISRTDSAGMTRYRS
ncbi:MAG: retroviral-like aspartic protease family protein [Dehalococcoidia bacterium]